MYRALNKRLVLGVGMALITHISGALLRRREEGGSVKQPLHLIKIPVITHARRVTKFM